MGKKIKFIDPFAGIGGFRYGLEKASGSSQYATKKSRQVESKIQFRGKRASDERGWNSISDRYKGLSGNRNYICVWSNEWDKYARQIYKKHYGECDGRDIRTVPTSEIPDHDLLCAGWPCQSFSVAGKRLGFEDTRGTLFFDIARILHDKRPRYFLLENVKGLLSHEQGKTFQTILGVLSDLGYRCEWQVLNSKHFGVPQNRERVFIIGYLGEGSGCQVFPLEQSSGTDQKNYETANCLDANYHRGWRYHGQRTMVDDTSRIRRLTPVECERLQGFPDGWTEGISDTQRYKCLGNAVTTNVIAVIGQRFGVKDG